MIAVGRHLASIVHGDRHPAALYHGGHLISGAVIAAASGTGMVDLGEQPYQAALPSVRVYGQGRQRRLSGYNLLDLDAVYNPFPGSVHGTVTVGDGSLTLRAGRDYEAWVIGAAVKENQVYTLTAQITTQQNAGHIAVDLYDAGTNRLQSNSLIYDAWNSGSPGSFRTVPGTAFAQIGFRSRKAGMTSVFAQPLLAEGTQARPWEPYCGGRPSPNPDYPQLPEFVEGAAITDGLTAAELPLLRGLPGSPGDELELREGRLLRRIGQITFDGSEDEHWTACHSGWTVQLRTDLRSAGGFCDRLILGTDAVLTGDDFVLTEPVFDTEPQLRSWLAAHPLTVWYARREPVAEQLAPVLLYQRPGHTVLTQQGGRAAEINAQYYKETK